MFIPFPSVPPLPGVPPLLRSQLNALAGVTGILAKLDGLGLPSNLLTPVWGLFDSSNRPVFVVDSVISFGIQNSMRVSDSPMEKGAFSSYNKTGAPYEASMRVAIGGTQATREALTTALDVALKSTNLYTIVTPDGTYGNATLESYDYRRENRNGAGMILVDLSLKEVRETAVAQFSNAAGSQTPPIAASSTNSPSAASPTSIGQVQPAALTIDETAAVSGGTFA